MAMLAIAGVVVFSSCDPEDEGLAAPSISLTTSPAHSDNVIEAEVGEEIEITVNVTAPGGFNVLRVTGGFSATYDRDEAGQTSFSKALPTLIIPAEAAGGTITLNFEAVDDADSVTNETLTINVGESPIETFEAVLLGSQGNANQGFLDLLTGTKYGYAGARDNTGSVDLGYYWGASDKSSIASIDDDGMDAVYSAVDLPIDGVFDAENTNVTRFVALTGVDFEAIDNAEALEEEAVFESAGSSSITELQVGDVIAFKTDAARGGVYGLIKVTAINDTNGTGTITIEVKVPVTE